MCMSNGMLNVSGMMNRAGNTLVNTAQQAYGSSSSSPFGAWSYTNNSYPATAENNNPYGLRYNYGSSSPTASAGQDTGKAMQNMGYGLMALGGLSDYKAKNAQYDNDINNLEANKAITQRNIFTTGYAGAVAANDARRQGREAVAKLQASYGGSGVASNSGSAASAISAASSAAEENAQRIQYNAMLKQWGMQNDVNNMNAQIKNLKEAKSMNKYTSLITTATNLAKAYYGWGGVG